MPHGLPIGANMDELVAPAARVRKMELGCLMVGRRAISVTFLGLSLLLSACGGGGLGPSDSTYFRGVQVPLDDVEQWNVVAVDVVVSDDLSVSENPQVRFPNTDIVWWEDPEGDRRSQVAAIVRNAAAQAVADLRGGLNVQMTVNVRKFHALTPFARQNGFRGWHDVVFDVIVTDNEGAILASESGINADIKAYQGAQAYSAVEQGQTQKIRIARRISQVIAEWLGID